MHPADTALAPATCIAQANKRPVVEIVAMYGGADGFLIKDSLDHGAKGGGGQGLGWGNVNKPMFAVTKDAIANGCDSKHVTSLFMNVRSSSTWSVSCIILKDSRRRVSPSCLSPPILLPLKREVARRF
jgi:hypothetical protein